MDPFVAGSLSGCTEVVTFDDQLTYARAVGTLLGCHQHHFAAIPDAGRGWAIACSRMATECLRDMLLADTRSMVPATAPTSPPPPPPTTNPPF